MSTASLSWAVAAFVSLSSVCSPAVSAQTPPVGPPPPDTTRPPVVGGLTNVPPDPLRGNPATMSPLGSQARTMQDGFEGNHRTGLRFYNGGADASCEVPLGRICYWNNNGDVPPPAERNDAKLEREQLLDLLAQAQAADPKDDWVNGMRVRYAIESEQREDGSRRTKRYDIDLTKCIFCGFCEESCPVDSIVETHIFEYHGEKRGDLYFTKDMLLAVGDRYEREIAAHKAADAKYR